MEFFLKTALKGQNMLEQYVPAYIPCNFPWLNRPPPLPPVGQGLLII